MYQRYQLSTSCIIPNNQSSSCSSDERKAHVCNYHNQRQNRKALRGTVENCGSYRSDQFQNNPMSHKGESEKSFRGESLVSLEVFRGTEKAGTLQFGEKAGWRKVMIEVYKTMGTTDSWMQNYSSPKLTIFRNGDLSTKLAGVWLKRDKNSPSFHREQ